MNATRILEVNGVSYMGNVLQDVVLNIEKGEVTAIIGPNGSGKTSLMKILAGIVKPSFGYVKYFVNTKIAYIPQSIFVDRTFPLNGYDFITISKHKIDKKLLNEIVEIADIQKLLDKQMSQISGGELQKLLLIKALAIRPNIMILDEPVSAMDICSRKKFYEIIKMESMNNDCTIIMTSHDIHVVMNNTDRIICLNHKVCCDGEPHHIINDEKFISMFGDNHKIHRSFHDDV